MLCVCVGLTIGFTTTSVTVMEGMAATLCAEVQNGMLGRDVPIQFATQDDSAEC